MSTISVMDESCCALGAGARGFSPRPALRSTAPWGLGGHSMIRHLKTAAVAGAFGATLALGIAVGHATADQPHMQNALGLIASARAELQSATTDKGGHRAKAIQLL